MRIHNIHGNLCLICVTINIQPNLSSLALQTNTGDEIGECRDSSDDESDNGRKNLSNNARKSKGSKEAGIYVPPKLSAVHYDDGDSKAERNRKQIERVRKRTLK